MTINFRMELHHTSATRLRDTLRRWEGVTARLVRPVNRIGGDLIVRSFAENIAEGNYAWAPLAPWTEAERGIEGFGRSHPILVRTGGFRASVIDRGHPLHYEQIFMRGDGFDIAFGSDDPRFDLLHNGGLNDMGYDVPARPFLYLGIDQQERLFNAISYAVSQALGMR